ncbi:MAG: glycoside hydrolase family 3 N-terminal domain-containing protein, partial [Eubacteriales bacterium]|nr:glycoside hydrolase family 3 N-terminal domain-containing protein [Eubacteriales bacterium]
MKWVKRWMALCAAALALAAGAARAEDLVERVLKSMTLEQKVYQLFFVTPEAAGRQSRVTEPTRAFLAQLEKHPVGGLILFADNFVSKAQTLRLTEAVQAGAGNVGYFIGTDEEGGGVSRAINKLHLQKV